MKRDVVFLIYDHCHDVRIHVLDVTYVKYIIVWYMNSKYVIYGYLFTLLRTLSVREGYKPSQSIISVKVTFRE